MLYLVYVFMLVNYSFYLITDRELRFQHGTGPCNVFILDTSSSLGKEGFTQMKEAFTSIIDGDVFKMCFTIRKQFSK